MKDLVLSSFAPDVISLMFEEAEISYQQGNEVTLVVCNDSICQCPGNPSKNKSLCYLCRRFARKMEKLISKGIKVIPVNAYATDAMHEEVNRLTFDYQTVKDIKKLEFHHVRIGYGCMSAYITCTRNNDPLIDDEFRTYFDDYLHTMCYQTLLHEAIIDQEKPDHISFFNGRTSEARSALNIAEWKHIDFTSCECRFLFPHTSAKRYTHNSLSHSISKVTELIQDSWEDKTVPEKDKIRLGKWFFESKVTNRFFGDTNYTGKQNPNQLPEGWDEKKYNIVIFNSSEDEHSSISDEFDDNNLFPSQIEGIEWVAKALMNADDTAIYLRIHPNLRNVKYKYHTDLLKLGEKYSNFHVIPGNSKISSYNMMYHASLVLVFGSTIGVESAYAGKPVITLAACTYMKLGFCYVPKTTDELMTLLNNHNLKPLKNENTLKFGYFCMNPHQPGFYFFNNDKRMVRVLGREGLGYPMDTVLGSMKLAVLERLLVNRFFVKDRLPRKEK